MNVLVTSTTFIPSVILCGHSQLNYLEKQGKINYRFIMSHFTKKEDVEWANIIIFLRSDSDIDAYISKIARKAKKHLIYVLDDDLLNIPPNLTSTAYYSLPSTKRNIRRIMSNCDTFLTPSPVLLKKYGGSFNKAFLIDEPSLNRIEKKEKNNKIKIGFAGSVDRANDLNQILDETIKTLLEKYKDLIEIEFMGAKPSFLEKYHLKYLPYQDGYDAYTAFMSQCNWDIGLAPMPESEFHKCKYFNKFVEYASFGIVGVYSNLEPYVYGIKDGVNGLLVNNTTKEWVSAISKLIENNKYRNKISKECLKQANEIYSLEKCSEDYLNKVLANYKEESIDYRIPSLEFEKFLLFFVRVFRKIKQEGRNFPEWLRKKIDKKIEDKKKERQDNANKAKVYELIDKNKTISIIAPMFDESKDKYNQRVKSIDDKLSDYIRIYLDGENWLTEHLEVKFVDKSHVVISFNSYDANQTKEVLNIVELTKTCLIHSVIRFMREKISPDMFKVFDLKDTKIIWDTHGMIPEEYHKKANYHTEQITNDIEKVFANKTDIVLCETNTIKKHFEDKYPKIKAICVVSSKTKNINI